MRTLFAALLVLGLVFTSCAQEKENQEKSTKESDKSTAQTGTLPNGWQLRLDYPSKSADDITFEQRDGEYHIVTGPRAIYYKAGMEAAGSYTLRGTFTQNKETSPEAYGLFLGGEDLQNESQHYLYFLIRQDGKYLIKRREGSSTSTIVSWTTHKNINPIGDAGPVTNSLAVSAEPDTVQFLVNGAEVQSIARDNLKYTKGIVGLRVNHRLDLTITDFTLNQQ